MAILTRNTVTSVHLYRVLRTCELHLGTSQPWPSQPTTLLSITKLQIQELIPKLPPPSHQKWSLVSKMPDLYAHQLLDLHPAFSSNKDDTAPPRNHHEPNTYLSRTSPRLPHELHLPPRRLLITSDLPSATPSNHNNDYESSIPQDPKPSPQPACQPPCS